jgi:hypothetical protein
MMPFRIPPFLRRALMPALFALALPAAAAGDEHAASRYKFNVPPSADIDYAVTAKQSGFTLDGQAHVKWRATSDTFSLVTEMRAMLFGKILDAKTEGVIDQFGLAPVTFYEKRMRKNPTLATFDREGNTIRFKDSDATYPIKGGEQDRNSAIWQLIAVARAAPARLKPGSEWQFSVVSPNDAEPWIFKVVDNEKIRTALGELNTVHILKKTADDSKRQRVEIWLAPSLDWYPARLRYTDPDGDFIEQSVVAVARPAP